MTKRLVQLEVTTTERLKREGQMGETYDQVINRLIDKKPKPTGGPMRPCVSLPNTHNAGAGKKIVGRK